jgi:hypothetical protein
VIGRVSLAIAELGQAAVIASAQAATRSAAATSSINHHVGIPGLAYGGTTCRIDA